MSIEDKTIIIFFIILIISIFLDKQAKKQQQSFLSYTIKKTHISELTASVPELPSMDVNKKAEEIINESKKIRKVIKNPLENQVENEIKNSKEKKLYQYKLFFPRFTGKNGAKMYYVKRQSPTEPTPELLLEDLKQGPKGDERNLVNAFYKNIQINGIRYLPEKGVVHLYFSQNFVSKDEKILKDRIDQICLTMKQLPEIEEIYYWIDDMVYYKQTKCDRSFHEYEN